ncbi:MAG: peptidoglycan-binding protein [Gammaproteobacteria bacterium]|nr:peptidoglycan-binding protein [Gammaproteobacteria bacterium]
MRGNSRVLRAMIVLIGGLGIATASGAGGLLGTKKGKGGSDVQGAAGTQGAQGAAQDLERCDRPMGAMAVVEPQDFVTASLAQYGLQSPVGLIRMMIQQSNCFVVVERGTATQNIMQERALAGGGELRGGSNMGGGQMVAADFILTPSVVFSESDAGKIAGGLGGLMGGRGGGLFGRGGGVLGAIAGGLKFKEAQTSMLVADARSGVQVAAAEGSSKKADLALGGLVIGGGAAGGLGGYSNANEGKIIAASFADNYNNVVRVIRNDPTLQRDVGTLAQEAAAGGSTQAGAVFSAGDVLHPKINGVKLMGTPGDAGQVLATLGKSDEMVCMGQEQDGYVQVESGQGAGWVKKIFVAK